MTFDPAWPQVPEVYLSYTGTSSGQMTSYISRFTISNAAGLPVTYSEEIILSITQDFTNHNGGDIGFGPDNLLYIGLGDGGSSGDPAARAQDTTRMLGSFLRIDVRGIDWPVPGYLIPPGNPFALNPSCGPGANYHNCPEIYAWGFRNPWRWSFDRDTGTLWAGDVGQNQWEEVDIIQPGGNYGWDCREGKHDFEPAKCGSGNSLIDPVAEYDHTLGNSITGGFVYRGQSFQSLSGRYIFGDFGSGRIWALQPDGNGGYRPELLIDSNYSIVSFAVDQAGEIFVLHFGGTILKLEPVGIAIQDTIPDLLSSTGCVSSEDPSQPAPGLIPYTVNAPFWSDGADKARYLSVPDNMSLDITKGNDWNFPPGSVLMKTFQLESKLIETRLLVRYLDGQWHGYTYEWNDAQTDATRVRSGRVRQLNTHSWMIPSESQCMECHTAAAGIVLGLETAQINKNSTYLTGRTANQLTTLNHIGLFSSPLSAEPDSLPKLPDPAVADAPLDSRARSYLHTNCSQCHRPGGPTPSDMDLRFDAAFQDTNTCDALPLNGVLDLAEARIISPGNPTNSILTERINRRDINGMPPLGSSLVDKDGLLLLRDWIESLDDCP